MKINNRLKLALAAGLMLGAAPAAFAAPVGTAAGATVSNTASLAYEVNSVPQTDIPSNTTNFVVDRVVRLTVAEVGGAATDVVPAANAQVLTYTVTNDSNDTLDFRLVASQFAGGTGPFGGTDNFNATGLSVFVEDGTTPGTYEVAEDTATFIDELASGDSVTVYVVANIPSGRVDGDVAAVHLRAFAAGDQLTSGDGTLTATATTLAADLVETNTALDDDAAFVDTVFGDTAGTATGDVAGDGSHSDDDQYNVVTAAIAVTKSSLVVTDPFNCTIPGDNSSCTNPPKAIPGAIVEYCLDIDNTGSVAASAIVLTDGIPTNTTYVAGSILTDATGTGAACDIGSGTSEDDNAAGVDETDPDGGSFAAGNVSITSPTVNDGTRWKASFRVTID